MMASTASTGKPIRLLSLGKLLVVRLPDVADPCSDGGGIRGLSTLLILQHLMKLVNPDNPPKPCEYFDLIGGTSTGGYVCVQHLH